MNAPKLLPPDHPDAPKYWMYETSGVLKPAVEKYLNGKWLTRAELGAMKAYLCSGWIPQVGISAR